MWKEGSWVTVLLRTGNWCRRLGFWMYGVLCVISSFSVDCRKSFLNWASVSLVLPPSAFNTSVWCVEFRPTNKKICVLGKLFQEAVLSFVLGRGHSYIIKNQNISFWFPRCYTLVILTARFRCKSHRNSENVFAWFQITKYFFQVSDSAYVHPVCGQWTCDPPVLANWKTCFTDTFFIYSLLVW